MIFELTTAGNFYSKEKKEKLENLGFRFELTTDEYLTATNRSYCKQSDTKVEMEINSMEDLMKLVEKYGTIIISMGCIEIYDDYRE